MTLKKLSILLLLLPMLLSYTDYNSNQKYMLSWIPSTCCVTNECCREIDRTEIRELNNEEVEIISTGQVKKKQYSPDGKYYRCACDYDGVNQVWTPYHQGANTRCVFVPQPGS